MEIVPFSKEKHHKNAVSNYVFGRIKRPAFEFRFISGGLLLLLLSLWRSTFIPVIINKSKRARKIE